jgi:hypothetical protein
MIESRLSRFGFGFVMAIVMGLLAAPNTAMGQLYELRTYTTNEGKLDALNTRFRDHTVALFEKHGMKSLGYWVPSDGPTSENTLIYVIEHKDADAAKASWKAFMNDPEWKEVYAKSESSGPILAKAPEAVYMTTTDYSPTAGEITPDESAVYELRIYKTNEGKLANLDARFRDHTVRLFDRHGIQSIAYWHPTQEPDSNDTLIYLLRHDSAEAAKQSWSAFGSDEEWKKVAAESQKDGQFLRERPVAIYLKATDYSAMK